MFSAIIHYFNLISSKMSEQETAPFYNSCFTYFSMIIVQFLAIAAIAPIAAN
jgi:hypothetical protein